MGIESIKELPHDYNIERAFLSCILMNPDLIGQSKLCKDDFYNQEHRKIFEESDKLYRKGSAIDIVLLISVGCNSDYLFEIAADIISISSFRSYEDNIRQLSAYRHIIKQSQKVQSLAYDQSELSSIYTEIKDIAGVNTADSEGSSLIDVITDYIENIGTTAAVLAKYGYEEIDKITDGIFAGQLIVIGAGPSIGKTMLAINFADNIMKSGIDVCLFPLEMSKIEMAKRFITKRTKIPSNILNNMKEEKEEIIWKIGEGLGDVELGNMKIFKNGNRPEIIMQTIRREAIQNNQKIFIIDHLGLMVEHKQGITKADTIGYITGGLKNLAEELEISIILLSQLNRAGQSKMNKPDLNNLRDSGHIEQDASVVFLMHLEDEQMYIDLAKVRDGEKGSLTCTHDYKLMSITNVKRYKELF